MKRLIAGFLVFLSTFVFVGVVAADHKPSHKPIEVSTKDVSVGTIERNIARMAQSCGTSNTYLHLACATESAFGWVEYDCCRVLGRNGYNRFNANRVDIDVRAYRSGRSQCRWVIVRGDDLSRYSYYHPNYSWRNC